MITHLSVRLCWHDAGWNGRICKNPQKNRYCINLDHIRKNRDPEFESFEIANKGKCVADFDYEEVHVPCRNEICVFSPKGYIIKHYHPLRKIPGYDLAPCTEKFFPYALYPAPYRWLMVKHYDNIRKEEKLNLRDLRDEDKYSFDSEGKNRVPKTWIDNSNLQEKILNHFWDKIIEKKSLVVFYLNSTPAAEDTRRVIAGLGRIKEKCKMSRFGNSKERPGPNYVWQRQLIQNYPTEGFRLPYQEYLEQGVDTSKIIVTAPENFENEFKYVAEHVSDGAMLAVTEKLVKVVDVILEDISEGCVKLNEDWLKHKHWLQKIIGELWKNRGQCPGVGSVLQFLGFNRGMFYHQDVLMPLENKNENVLQYTLDILDNKRVPDKGYQNDFESASPKWKTYSSDKNRRAMLELLMRMELSEDQVERIIKGDMRYECGIKLSESQIINNPYLIAEYDKGQIDNNGNVVSEKISLDIVDQAMVPLFLSPTKIKPDDDRRVRALMIESLKNSADKGDTLLGMGELLDKVRKRFVGDRGCRLDLFLLKANKSFYEDRLVFIGDNDNFVALKEIRSLEGIVSAEIKELMNGSYGMKAPDWNKIIDKRFGKVSKSKLSLALERKARSEKITVLNTLFAHKFSVLTGRAGTGKTEVLNIFIEGLLRKKEYMPDDFLILAPTGKARVRIKGLIGKTMSKTQLNPQTIHQHLNKHAWFDQNFELKELGGQKTFAKVVIVDESSMIPVDLFATLLKSIDFSNVKRFILVGDSNQLPPIGPGRPFDDIVRWLKDNEEYRKHLGNLQQRVRHKEQDSVCLRLADGFLRDFKSKDMETLYMAIERGKLHKDDDLYFKEWNNHDDLLSKLEEVLRVIGITDYDSYKKSVGITDRDLSKCESWQVLSPVKHKEISGTISLNNYLQNKFLSETLKKWRARQYYGQNARYPTPFGKTKDIVHEDKVIQVRNTRKIECYPANHNSYVANGEVGLVRFPFNHFTDRLNVSFSDQPEFSYTYYNGEGERSVELNLDLAYAITIHKSQGSDFDKVILIIPEKVHNISTEMMYTALTRFKEKTYLLVQGGINTLQKYRHANSSATNWRNTFLFKLAVRDDIQNIPYAENRIHRTKSGFLVRSKSEVIIANELINAGISLSEENYETKLLSKKIQYDYKLPDFTFVHKGKQFFWEHLGMLSFEAYRKSWEDKLKWYEKNGYKRNLIVSQDGPGGSIDSRDIDAIIEKTLGLKIMKDDIFNLDSLEESQNVEFKSSISWDYNTQKKNRDLEVAIAKVFSAFMNSSGGLLLIGIDDGKNVLGIDCDLKTLKKQNEDGFNLKITEIVSNFIGKEYCQLIRLEFRAVDNKKIALIHIDRADEPTFVGYNNDTIFYIRTGNSAQPLNTKEASIYIKKHWG